MNWLSQRTHSAHQINSQSHSVMLCFLFIVVIAAVRAVLCFACECVDLLLWNMFNIHPAQHMVCIWLVVYTDSKVQSSLSPLCWRRRHGPSTITFSLLCFVQWQMRIYYPALCSSFFYKIDRNIVRLNKWLPLKNYQCFIGVSLFLYSLHRFSYRQLQNGIHLIRIFNH